MDLFFRYVRGASTLSAILLSKTSFQGMVPGAGDAVNAALGYTLVIRKAKQAELSDDQLFLFSVLN